ncbi:plant virulence effector HPE1-like domain-containing protein [Rhizobium panacihumi]|uniref:plant virulence effector HPE1-like domain-containing protein n=1 Tax=Rhizobium panacihumi TaxID=2008450 RepID=UPI003D7BB583
MRHLVLTAAILSIGSPAFASSISKLVETGRTTSIVEHLCSVCDQSAPVKPVDGPGVYHVPSLGSDIQKTEIRNIDGQEKLVRTEEWWGGSPVTFITNVPGWMTTPEQKADATQPMRSGPVNTARIIPLSAPDGVDADATTAAVGEQPGERAGETIAQPDDFKGFELRGE